MNDGKLTVMYVVQETGDIYLLFVHIDDLSFKRIERKKISKVFLCKRLFNFGTHLRNKTIYDPTKKILDYSFFIKYSTKMLKLSNNLIIVQITSKPSINVLGLQITVGSSCFKRDKETIMISACDKSDKKTFRQY